MVTVSYHFSVHGDPVAFENALRTVVDYVAEQPGCLGTRVYRVQGRHAAYVAAADWIDDDAQRRAAGTTGFRSRIRAMVGLAAAEPEVLDLLPTTAAVA
jgi:quinol monooxygenase YgiN